MIRDFLFADDCALNAGTEQDMQDSMNKFSTACDNFGLTISMKKTEVMMYQPAPDQIYTPPQILVKKQPLPVTNKFAYLGSTLSNSAVVINNRIAKGCAAFGRLRKTVWESTWRQI